jgi:hypothetical protein
MPRERTLVLIAPGSCPGREAPRSTILVAPYSAHPAACTLGRVFIVEAHEGELSVASAGRNCGATFSVILQLAETEPEKQDRPAQTRSRAIARARRVSQRTR